MSRNYGIGEDYGAASTYAAPQPYFPPPSAPPRVAQSYTPPAYSSAAAPPAPVAPVNSSYPSMPAVTAINTVPIMTSAAAVNGSVKPVKAPRAPLSFTLKMLIVFGVVALLVFVMSIVEHFFPFIRRGKKDHQWGTSTSTTTQVRSTSSGSSTATSSWSSSHPNHHTDTNTATSTATAVMHTGTATATSTSTSTVSTNTGTGTSTSTTSTATGTSTSTGTTTATSTSTGIGTSTTTGTSTSTSTSISTATHTPVTLAGSASVIAVARSGDTVLMTFDTVPAAAYYTVYYSTSSQAPYTIGASQVLCEIPNAASVQVEITIPVNHTYTFGVQAFGATGSNVIAGPIVWSTPAFQYIGVPTPTLSLNQIDATSALISWTSVSNVSGHGVYTLFLTTDNVNYTPVITNTSETSIELQGLGVPCQFYMTARIGNFASNASNHQSFTPSVSSTSTSTSTSTSS